ncbi:3467_t:CDS:2, partial [Racocetra persica]
LSGAPCKHQGAVAAKYHIGSLNFLPSLTPNNCACFAYIARGVSFYASLHSQTNYSQCKNYNYPKVLHNVFENTHELETANAEVNMDISQTTETEL